MILKYFFSGIKNFFNKSQPQEIIYSRHVVHALTSILKPHCGALCVSVLDVHGSCAVFEFGERVRESLLAMSDLDLFFDRGLYFPQVNRYILFIFEARVLPVVESTSHRIL